MELLYPKNTYPRRDTIKIRKLRDIPSLVIHSLGDWIDLTAAEDVVYEKDSFIFIPLGFSAQLPDDYEAIILPRSSTARRYGLLHASSGLIDNSYCGDNDEWMFLAYAIRDGVVEKGSRICQFRIQRRMQTSIIEYVESLSGPDRGGFGSTGK